MSTFIGMGVSKKAKDENKKIKALTETVDVLTKKNGELEAEKVTLTETVDTLTKKVEELTQSIKDKTSEKNKDKE